MKLERLNENQIRATLDKSDLDQRELHISELAYGSAKARQLFQDLMQQASYELGFEVENIPLVVEAIPISSDCLILVVTKVENPDEMDHSLARLARLTGGLFGTPSHRQEDEDDPDGDGVLTADDDPALADHLDGIDEGLDPLGLLAPFVQAIAEARKASEDDKDREKDGGKEEETSCLFLFRDLDQIIRLSSFLTPFYKGGSVLYKDTAYSEYYLFLNRDEASVEHFLRACTIASDYGAWIPVSYAADAWCREHCQPILKEKALETLNLMNS